MARKPITCCPHCGSDEGIYTKTTLVNVPYKMGFDGCAQYNEEMYDNAEKITSGRTVYCQSCQKPICRWDTMEKQWDGCPESRFDDDEF